MTDNRHSRHCFSRARNVVAGLSLVATAMLLVACATPVPPASTREPATAENSQRSSKSSGIAYRDGSVPVVRAAPPMVGLAGAHRMGSSQAMIGIVEFSDYQCPYCRGFHDRVFPKLKKEYVDTGIAQFIHKDLPLKSIHPQALPAALAASCAGLQKRFWPMHAALYANNGRLASALYPQLVRELGLDEAKFMACLGDASREQAVMRDVVEARGLGITGTPSFVIGKIEGDVLTVVRVARGAPSFEDFAQEIEKLRKTMDAGATPQTK